MDLDKELKDLDAQSQDRVSDFLPKIWAGIERRHRERALSKVVLTWQTSVLAFAVVTSVLVGTQAVPTTTGSLGVFSPHAALSPSTLLSRQGP